MAFLRPREAWVLAWVLLAACLATRCQASLGKYTWGETANSWWSLASKSTVTPAYPGTRIRCAAASSDGKLLYVAGSTIPVPPGLAGSWIATSGSATRGFFLVIEGSTGAVKGGVQVLPKVPTNSYADEVYGITVVGGATSDTVYIVGSTQTIVSTLGQTRGGAAGSEDAFLAKITVDISASPYTATTNWVTQWGSAKSDIAYLVATSSSGSDIYVAGGSADTIETGVANKDSRGQIDTTYDVFLAKFDTSGTKVWASMLSSASNTPNAVGISDDLPTGLTVSASGDIFIASRWAGTTIVSMGNTVTNTLPALFDWAVTKVTESGGTPSIAWTVAFPSGYYNSNKDDQIIGVSASGTGVVFAGTICANAGNLPSGEKLRWGSATGTYANGLACSTTDFIGKLTASGTVAWFSVMPLYSASSSADVATSFGVVPTAGASPQYYMAGYAYLKPHAPNVTHYAYVKSFSDGGTAAASVNADMALVDPADFMPASYTAVSGVTDSVFITGVGSTPTSSDLPSHPVYIAGYTVDNEEDYNNDIVTPVAMKLVQTPPPRKLLSALLIAGSCLFACGWSRMPATAMRARFLLVDTR